MTTRNRPVLLALLVDVLTAALALAWLTGILVNPLRAAEDALILLAISPAALAWLALVTAACRRGRRGLAVLERDRDDRSALLVAVAVPQIVVFGFALQGMGTIALAGYLVAFAVPAAGIVLAVQVVRRYPRLRAVVAAALIAVAALGPALRHPPPDSRRSTSGQPGDGLRRGRVRARRGRSCSPLRPPAGSWCCWSRCAGPAARTG